MEQEITLRDRMRGALPGAMRARDGVAVAALRSALAAIDNAEAVDPGLAPQPADGHEHLAGTVVGVGTTEAPRRALTDTEVAAIVRMEVDDRRSAAADYERRSRGDQAERLRREADVLDAQLER